MIARALLAAIMAGLFSGLFMTAVQTWRVVPLIKIAEIHEDGASAAHDLSTHAAESEPAGHDHGESAALTGRFAGTLLANLVLGAGFALVLVGISLVSGRALTAANGLAWGACGWLAVQLLPALGLPPELPGFPYVDLAERQIWWSATVVASGIGLMLAAWGGNVALRLAGLALIVAPQLVGVPVFEAIEGGPPALVASDYAAEALGSTLAFWLVLGLLAGLALDRVAAQGNA